jgi:hypothetical protein
VLRNLIFFTFLILTGCIPPREIKPERIAEIKKVGIVTRLQNNELIILDHTGVMKKSYTYGQFGALGALVEAGILAGIKEYKISKSINGDFDKLKPFAAEMNIKDSIDSKLIQKLSNTYLMVEPQYFDKNEQLIRSSTKCLQESKKMEVDTLVILDINYGLAAYSSSPASISIDSEMKVYDVNSGDIILQRIVESDLIFRESRTFEEFEYGNGRRLKEDLNSAVNAFAVFVARLLGGQPPEETVEQNAGIH